MTHRQSFISSDVRRRHEKDKKKKEKERKKDYKKIQCMSNYDSIHSLIIFEDSEGT